MAHLTPLGISQVRAIDWLDRQCRDITADWSAPRVIKEMLDDRAVQSIRGSVDPCDVENAHSWLDSEQGNSPHWVEIVRRLIPPRPTPKTKTVWYVDSGTVGPPYQGIGFTDLETALAEVRRKANLGHTATLRPREQLAD